MGHYDFTIIDRKDPDGIENSEGPDQTAPHTCLS